MKSVLTSIAVASLLASFAIAQPVRGRGLPFRAAAGPSHVPTSPGNHRLVYVVTVGLEFGAIDLSTGAFLPIGPGLPANVGDGLVPGPGRFLLSLGFDGNLIAIDPATGTTSVVGPTGLGDCSTPASPCGPNSANWIGYFDGKYYATDFAQNLYSVNPETGKARLIGPTGIPPLTFPPFSPDPDGVSFDVFGETLFSSHGRFYAFFCTLAVNPADGTFRFLIPEAIYEINPKTGHAMLVTPMSTPVSTVVDMDNTVYAFNGVTGEVVTLDVATGQTSVVSTLDPSVGPVAGATPARPVLAGIH